MHQQVGQKKKDRKKDEKEKPRRWTAKKEKNNKNAEEEQNNIKATKREIPWGSPGGQQQKSTRITIFQNLSIFWY